MEKVKLTDILEADYTKDVNITNDTSMYDPLNEDDQDGTLKYTTNIDGRGYKVSFDVNKNPTKTTFFNILLNDFNILLHR